MKKFLGLLVLAALCGTPALAQVTPKIELFAGGAFNRFDTPRGYYLDMPGWTVSANYTVFRWLSGKVEGSGDYGRRAFVGSTSTYNLLAGPQFFPFRHHRITPWGEFLFGEGYYRNTVPAVAGFPSATFSGYSFTWEGGMGLDWRLKGHWDLRPIEFDYVSSKYLATQPNQLRQSNYRLQIGVVYRIGKHGL